MSTTATPAPSTQKPPSKFETALNAFLKIAIIGGAAFGPVFIHSEKGIAIFNASEGTLEAATGLLQAKQS